MLEELLARGFGCEPRLQAAPFMVSFFDCAATGLFSLQILRLQAQV